jgi:glycosyltransferase involved in cell wall biosynthesis
MPKVSVIVPTYNGAQYIGQAIDSVLAQSIDDFEIIVVDDGSTDSTPAMLKEFSQNDSRIRVVTREKPSGGPTIPKNLALSMVRSPYVSFLDHDDYIHPDKLAAMCAGMDAHPEWVAAFHDLQLVNADGQAHTGTYLSNVNFISEASSCLRPLDGAWFDCDADFYQFMSLRFAAIHTASVIVAPQRLLADPVGFRERFKGCDDTDLWLRIAMQGNVGFLNRVLAYYRLHDSNLSLDTTKMTGNGVAVHEDNYLRARNRMTDQQLTAYRKKITSYQLDLGYKLNVEGEYAAAKKIYFDVLRSGRFYQPLRGICKAMVMQYLKQDGGNNASK